MNLQLKICGMREAVNITSVADLGPQWMGFIFYPGSPRFVGEDFVMPALPAGIQTVGVFVSQPQAQIQEHVIRHGLHSVQLHGTETPRQVAEARKLGVVVIKAFSLHPYFDFDEVKSYHSVANYFLFDTRGKMPGGTGQLFDWKILQRYDQQTPFFLSGGLGVEELDQLQPLKGMNLVGVDLNSRLEDSPGVKNVGAVRLAIEKLANVNI